jgi:hypothetical protein
MKEARDKNAKIRRKPKKIEKFCKKDLTKPQNGDIITPNR